MERPEVTRKVVEEFAKILDVQDKKGVDKYGKTIDDAEGYDWKMMALEETADLQKYLVKRIFELEASVKKYEEIFDTIFTDDFRHKILVD